MRIEDGSELRRIPVLGLKPLIGVIHLPAVNIMSRRAYSVEDAIEYAVSEARKLENAGFDGVIVENYGDKPYSVEAGVFTATVMAVIAREIRRSTSLIVGVNVLRNDYEAALAAAYASGASFVRVNVYCEHRLSIEGLLEPVASRIEDIISRIARHIAVFADIDVKHSVPLKGRLESPEIELYRDCASRGKADAFIVTGRSTGSAPDPGYVAALKNILASKPVIVGSGVSVENIKAYWDIADGFIVGSSIKVKGVETVIDPHKAEAIARIVKDLRKQLIRGL